MVSAALSSTSQEELSRGFLSMNEAGCHLREFAAWEILSLPFTEAETFTLNKLPGLAVAIVTAVAVSIAE